MQSKNSAEGENGFSFFGSDPNSVTESTVGFSGFDFSKDLEAINDEAESQQDEITTKKTTKVTTSSSSKSTESKQNKSNDSKDKDKKVTVKPTSKSVVKSNSKSSSNKNNSNKNNSNKKDEDKKFNFDSSRHNHDDFDFDENLILRFRRQNNKKNGTHLVQSNENDGD